MLKKILIGLAALVVSAIAVLVGLAAMQPDSFHIERSATIEAPPEAIYAILADFRRSTEWSPFEKTDPDMKRAFSGADKGKGAVYTWDGNSEAGAGRIEIVEASAPSKLVLTLDFERPMEGHNIVEYTLAPDGDATNVTWAIHGPCRSSPR